MYQLAAAWSARRSFVGPRKGSGILRFTASLRGRCGPPRVIDDAAVPQLDPAVRTFGYFPAVRRNDHGVAAQRQPLQLVNGSPAVRLVQSTGRLVGKDHAAAVHQGAGDRHALLLAARQFGRRMPGAVCKPGPGQQVRRPLPERTARRSRIHPWQRDIVDRAGRFQEIVGLENEAEGLAPDPGKGIRPQRAHLAAREAIRTARGAVEASQDVQQRGLARTGRPGDADEFACVDLQRDIA